MYRHLTVLLIGQGTTDFHAKTPEKNRENWARRPLMFLGAWKTEGALRGRACYLVALETTRWVFWRRLEVCLVVNTAAGVVSTRFGPGLVARPSRSGLADDASEERTGFCSFKVDALL